jgi:hypothetical protein
VETFIKTRHDGKPSVICKKDGGEICFVRDSNRDRMLYSTEDKKEISSLTKMGYPILGNDAAEYVEEVDDKKGFAVYAVDADGAKTGRAKVVKDTLKEAEEFLLTKDIDYLNTHAIFPRT